MSPVFPNSYGSHNRGNIPLLPSCWPMCTLVSLLLRRDLHSMVPFSLCALKAVNIRLSQLSSHHCHRNPTRLVFCVSRSMYDIVIPPSPLDIPDAQPQPPEDLQRLKTRLGCMPVKSSKRNPLRCFACGVPKDSPRSPRKPAPVASRSSKKLITADRGKSYVCISVLDGCTTAFGTSTDFKPLSILSRER